MDLESGKTEIIEVSSHNIAQHPQAICFINPKHELYHKKVGPPSERSSKPSDLFTEAIAIT